MRAQGSGWGWDPAGEVRPDASEQPGAERCPPPGAAPPSPAERQRGSVGRVFARRWEGWGSARPPVLLNARKLLRTKACTSWGGGTAW